MSRNPKGRRHAVPPLRWWAVLAGLAMLLQVAGPRDLPIRVGLMADLTGRGARSNIDGRNGVMLAVERINEAGGVHGRKLELVVQDAGKAPGADIVAARRLLAAGVAVVIGPFSSGSAERVVPLFDAARVLLLCPSSADAALAGRDDQLLRLGRTARAGATELAYRLHAHGHRRLALATDMRDAGQHDGWRNDFVDAFTHLGGMVAAEAGFGAAPHPGLHEVVRGLLAAAPDGLVFVANGVDAARLAQQAARLRSTLPMAAPDWAQERALLEFGGRAVEGMLLASAARLAEAHPRYQGFHHDYVERFGTEPGDRAIAGYDAVTVVSEALAGARRGEPAREAVLRQGPYQGLQQAIAFDRFGDAARRAHFTVVRDGRFEAVP